MKNFSATANSSSTIGYAKYGYSSWNTGSSSGACQGSYDNTSSSGSRVGVMVFSNAGTSLKGKSITRIVFSITCSNSGSGSSSKVLTFYTSYYQYLNTSAKASAHIGTQLGTLTGKFYGNTSTHTLDASSNSSFFATLKQYLYNGNCTLILYNGEVCSSSQEYSSNYARITSITMTVYYNDETVWYNNGGTWVECYMYYRNNSSWVQVTPYYNSGGSWIKT